MQKTQTSDILQHLKDGRELTQKQAINEYGAYRLSSIIHSLRRQGHDIVSIPKKVKTRYKTKDGRTVKKGLYYYMNKRKKAGTSRKGTGTVSAKALKRSAKTAKKA